MKKLKTLIIEAQTELVLSKMEEERALKILILKLLPFVVMDYNKWINDTIDRRYSRKPNGLRKKFYKTDIEELKRNIKKIERKPNKATYQIVLKNGHVKFIIEKDIDLFENRGSIYIKYSGPVDIGWENASGYQSFDLEYLLKK